MLQFMGLQRVRHDLATEQQTVTYMCVCMGVGGCVGLTQKFFPFSSKNKRLIFHFHQNLH